jgi:hypothetical protein
MLYSRFLEILNKHLYQVEKEVFSNDDIGLFMARFVMKHHLLKPELIVENDTIQGFKSAGKRLSTLEKFPIYVEIEGEIDPDNGKKIIKNVDIYSEANLKCQDRLSDVIFLAKRFGDIAILDRIIRLSNTQIEYLVIFSKVQDVLPETEAGMSSQQSDMQIGQYLSDYVNFIHCLHEVILKGKSIAKCQEEGLC